MNRPFDKARYKALLDGLEATELKLSEVKTGLRIDAEMYQKFHVNTEKLIKSHDFTVLDNETTSVKKGIFDIKADCYSDRGIPFVRISNLGDMLTDEEDVVFIPESEHLKNPETALAKNDVILSKTAYAAASLVTFPECNASQDTIAVKLKRQSAIQSQYLVAFLNTRYGLGQMQRWFTGNIQMHLNLNDCKNLPIPTFDESLQTRIKQIFKKSIGLRERSDALYAKAENLLLDELGLKDWRPSVENIAVKSFAESFGRSGRLDAEFYSPKYHQLEENLPQLGSTRLATVSLEAPQRGVQPEFVEGGSVFVIASKAVRPSGVLLDEHECTDEAFYNSRKNSKARLKKGDVLINGTGRGTLGRASIYDSESLAVADNHVTILRPNPSLCDPYYLMLFLSSIAGQFQSEKWQCGSSGQLELYPNQIEQFVIYAPKRSRSVQARISNLIQDSFARRKQSQAILQKAKRGIEIAIEQNEVTALKWIENQLKS